MLPTIDDVTQMTVRGLETARPRVRAKRTRSDLTVVVAMIAGLVAVGCSPVASVGSMPPPDWNGELDASSAPDFIAVAGRDGGIAGYARKGDVLAPGDAPFLVYAGDLRTVVGRMVPGTGFVPVGVDPASVPTFPVEVAPSADGRAEGEGQVVLYVRNDTADLAWVAVQAAGQTSTSIGFWGRNVGVGCYPMPTGSWLVLLDRSPEQPHARVTYSIYLRGAELEPPPQWIALASDGRVQHAMGVPEWWGAPQSC